MFNYIFVQCVVLLMLSSYAVASGPHVTELFDEIDSLNEFLLIENDEEDSFELTFYCFFASKMYDDKETMIDIMDIKINDLPPDTFKRLIVLEAKLLSQIHDSANSMYEFNQYGVIPQATVERTAEYIMRIAGIARTVHFQLMALYPNDIEPL